MEIRKATPEDLPAIIELFKMSLGEEGGVPTASFWRWKHFDNPFGPSPTLLMMDKERVVGLRTFMYWKWRQYDSRYTSLRCVDTATHPDYRGKGIFKKLTNQLLKIVEEKSLADFIFNTPNAMSMPGYLKMGWEVAGQTPLYLKLQGLNLIGGYLGRTAIVNPTVDELDLIKLLAARNSQVGNQLTTDYSIDYYKWRYEAVPGIEYSCWADDFENPSVVFFYRIKKTKGIAELRILDHLCASIEDRTLLLKGIRKVARKHQVLAVSILKPAGWSSAFLYKHSFFPFAKKGLTVTKKGVNNHAIYQKIDPAENWELSSGAIELF